MVKNLSRNSRLNLLNLFIDPDFFIDIKKKYSDKQININVIDYTNLLKIILKYQISCSFPTKEISKVRNFSFEQ